MSWERRKTAATADVGLTLAARPVSRRAALASAAGALTALALRPKPLLAAPSVDPVTEGSSSSRDRQAAIAALPMQKLDRAGKQKVNAVLANVTIFRRLPVQFIQCDPELYLFLIEHPDVTTNIWDVLGISQVALKRTGKATFNADDGAGTKSDIEFLHTAPDAHLLYAVGSYEGPLFTRAVRGGALLSLHSGFIKEQDGKEYLTCGLDVFCRVDHLGVELTAKTFKGMVGRTADQNFIESVTFLDQLSQAAVAGSQRVMDIAGKLENVSAEDRGKFTEIVSRLAEAKPTPPLPLRQATGGNDIGG